MEEGRVSRPLGGSIVCLGHLSDLDQEVSQELNPGTRAPAWEGAGERSAPSRHAGTPGLVQEHFRPPAQVGLGFLMCCQGP